MKGQAQFPWRQRAVGTMPRFMGVMKVFFTMPTDRARAMLQDRSSMPRNPRMGWPKGKKRK